MTLKEIIQESKNGKEFFLKIAAKYNYGIGVIREELYDDKVMLSFIMKNSDGKEIPCKSISTDPSKDKEKTLFILYEMQAKSLINHEEFTKNGLKTPAEATLEAFIENMETGRSGVQKGELYPSDSQIIEKMKTP